MESLTLPTLMTHSNICTYNEIKNIHKMEEQAAAEQLKQEQYDVQETEHGCKKLAAKYTIKVFYMCL